MVPTNGLSHLEMVNPSIIQLAEVLVMEPQYNEPVSKQEFVSSTNDSPIPKENEDHKDFPVISHTKLSPDSTSISDALLSVILSRVSQEKKFSMENLMQQTIHKEKAEKQILDEDKLDHLSEKHQKRVLALLSEYPAIRYGILGKSNSMEHQIELQPGKKPIFSQPYRGGPKQPAVAQAEIDRILRISFIERTQCPWASPIFRSQ